MIFFFLFFAVFTDLSLIEFYFRALILKSTSRSLGPLHNYSNIFFFIGFIFTINYAKIYTILVNLFILYQKKKEFCMQSLDQSYDYMEFQIPKSRLTVTCNCKFGLIKGNPALPWLYLFLSNFICEWPSCRSFKGSPGQIKKSRSYLRHLLN